MATPSEVDVLYADEELIRFKDEMRRAEMEAEAAEWTGKRTREGGKKGDGVAAESRGEDEEGEEEAHDQERCGNNPLDGEDMFLDDDGTVYNWDRSARLWVHQSEDTPVYRSENKVYAAEEEVMLSSTLADDGQLTVPEPMGTGPEPGNLKASDEGAKSKASDGVSMGLLKNKQQQQDGWFEI
ncbi:hypothetical protein CBR_g21137 [Chara braunii]|uniref:Uncharacterized protein n=1 Tax=Chara braunii TaxID=69332 RepID=A0A388L0S2_CHABU|nr:hypothetical protein CBR_g21137 [Chara braunii]|eukprot:GBG75895.1 hypothetical protein CBR_g21137 [Chara braunii]